MEEVVDADDVLDPAKYERVGPLTKGAFSVFQNWRYLLAPLGAYILAVFLEAQGASTDIMLFGALYLLVGGIGTFNISDLLNGVVRLEFRGEELPERAETIRRVLQDSWKILAAFTAVGASVLGIAASNLLPTVNGQSLLAPLLNILVASACSAIAIVFWLRILSEAKAGRNPKSFGKFFVFVINSAIALAVYQLSLSTGLSVAAFTISAFGPLAVIAILITHYMNLGDKLLDVHDLEDRIEHMRKGRDELQEKLRWLDQARDPRLVGNHQLRLVEKHRKEISRIDRQTAQYKEAIRLYRKHVSVVIQMLSSYLERRAMRISLGDGSPMQGATALPDYVSSLVGELGPPPKQLPRPFTHSIRFLIIRWFVVPFNMGLILNSLADSPVGFNDPSALRVVRYLDTVTYEEYSPSIIESHIREYERLEVLWIVVTAKSQIAIECFADFVLAYRDSLEKSSRLLRERIELFDTIGRIDPPSQYAALMKKSISGRQGLVRTAQTNARLLNVAREASKTIASNNPYTRFGADWNAVTSTQG